MSLLNFLQFYLEFLVLAALIICGFYIITRGEKIVQPDGSIIRKGKIFKQWSLFWERTTGTRSVYYCGATLEEKLAWLKQINSGVGSKLSLNAAQTGLVSIGVFGDADLSYIKEMLGCEIKVEEPAGTGPVSFLLYVKEPVYYFPEWLRFPLSQCPPCMASVGGTLLYWPLVLFSGNIMSWTDRPVWAYIFFWITFCLALSALNKLAYKTIGG